MNMHMMKQAMKTFKLKTLMQFSILIASITATSALLASGGFEDNAAAKNSMPVAINAQWKAECSSCHMAYPPSLLPAKSWKAIMAGLDKHFGENASLDAPTQTEITKFLLLNSADNTNNRRAMRINQSIPTNATPLRITETAYFTQKHDEISPATFKRKSVGSAANCIACHKGAEQGNFSESLVKIPR